MNKSSSKSTRGDVREATFTKETAHLLSRISVLTDVKLDEGVVCG